MWVKCACCKEKFYAWEHWAYRIKDKKTGMIHYFCRYNHLRQWEKDQARRKTKMPQAKWVKCMETGEVYPSAAAVARHYNQDLSAMYDACGRADRTYAGYHWQYVEGPDE